MYDQGIVGGTPLRGVDLRGCSGIEGIAAKSVDGFGRENDKTATVQNVCRMTDGGIGLFCVYFLYLISNGVQEVAPFKRSAVSAVASASSIPAISPFIKRSRV